MTSSFPTLEEFLAAPIEAIQEVAPATVIYNPGGTRRGAFLAGVPMDEYADWTTDQMLQIADLLFQHGVRHVFITLLGPKNMQEVTPEYREHLWRWAGFVAHDRIMTLYQQKGWRVRILYQEYLPKLRETVERLQETLSSQSPYTVWYMFTPERLLPLRWMRDALRDADLENSEETIRLLYGEAVPPATFFLGYGKPTMLAEFLPPFIYEELSCYWLQRPHYLDERELRTMFYDYAYLRRTWQQDKSERTAQVQRYRKAWENAPIVGLGTRLGPFWYPASIPEPPLPDDEV